MRKLTLFFLAVFFFINPQLFARGIRDGASFYNNRGLEYGNKGEYDRAIEDFTHAILLNPKVLLSACETGLGVLRRGDGMVGMVRAFLLAGSEYAGISLWEIDDEATLEFMTRLYTKVINEGITFKEAYYLVKNEFRYHDEWDHPNYWSAFVMYE